MLLTVLSFFHNVQVSYPFPRLLFPSRKGFHSVLSDSDQQPKSVVEQKRETGRYAIFLRSKRQIVLTGSETEEEARAAEKEPITIPRPPVFNTVNEQRVHMKQKLAAGFRLMAKFGWDEGKYDLFVRVITATLWKRSSLQALLATWLSEIQNILTCFGKIFDKSAASFATLIQQIF